MTYWILLSWWFGSEPKLGPRMDLYLSSQSLCASAKKMEKDNPRYRYSVVKMEPRMKDCKAVAMEPDYLLCLVSDDGVKITRGTCEPKHDFVFTESGETK